MKALANYCLYLVLGLLMALVPLSAMAAADAPSGSDRSAADPKPKASTIRVLKMQIEQLQREDAVKSQLLKDLARKVSELEAAQQQGEKKFEARQAEKEKELKAAVTTEVQQQLSTSNFSGFMDSYIGQHRFVITGSAAGTFEYDRNTNINTFAAQFEPIFLYRLSDWLAFESEIEAELPDDAESEIKLETAMAHLFLTDYLELQIGKSFTPFGDFIEDLHPFWVNKFVSMPLPFREGDDGGLLPFTTLGLQARGAFQWGRPGQDLDYTLMVGNPARMTDPDLVGSMFDFNNIATNTHGKSFAGRIRVYPLPVDAEMGRLELGASTYDSKWLDGHWMVSWGFSLAYLLNEFQVRAEYLNTQRQMGALASADNRQGYYVQLAYLLSRLPVDYLNRAELLFRWSAQDQRQVVLEDPTELMPPGNGMDISPQQFVPHPREVALGLDYWLSPSAVWKLEYDIELPRAGGAVVDPSGTLFPFHTPNDRAVMTQFAVGF